MLEQIAYEILRTEQRQQAYFVVGDLESLSASYLGYGSGPKLPLERGFGGGLTIRPLGYSQLHIHEGAGGSANIKHGDKSTPISSYDAAIWDWLMDRANLPKILVTDKSERKGRK